MTPLLQALADAELARAFEPQVLERGRQLAPEVSGLALSDDGAQRSAAAQVPGRSAPYAVQLWHAPGTQLRGRCPCAYARAGAPCKHQAALALAWRAQLAGDTLTAPAPAEDTALQAFLRGQSAAQLAAFLIAQSERLPELAQAVQQWQQGSLPVNDLAAAKRAVAAVLGAPRDLLEWRRVGAYVRKAEGVLPLLQAWTARNPAIALAAAEAACLKLCTLAEAVEDRDGAFEGLLRAVAAAHLAALQAAGPQPAAYAKQLHALLEGATADAFDLPALLHAAGPEASARYGQRCADDWAHHAAADPRAARRARSKQRLLAFHRAVGDGAAALALLRESPRTASDHIELVEELQRQGRAREALQAAEAAGRLHPDEPRLRELKLRAYEADGWDDEALQLRERDFQQHPSLSAYLGCLHAAVRAGQPEPAARERLWALLDPSATSNALLQGHIGGVKLELWRHEGRWTEALDWLATGGRSADSHLHDFALALPEPFHAIAVELLKPLLARKMERSSSPYSQELELVREITRRQDASGRALWLAWLRLEYRGKKRFVEGLNA